MAAKGGQSSKPAGKELAEGNLEFSLNLYKEFVKANGKDNVFFSPFSITVVLAMVNAGARNNTAKEIQKALRLDSLGDEKMVHLAFCDLLKSLNLGENKKLGLPFILHTANRMYVQESFKIVKEYTKVLTQYYSTDAVNVDFTKNPEETREQINQFVEAATRKEIKNLISSGDFDSSTRLILVNAIYFKGSWQKKFDPKHSFQRSFHRSNTDIVKTKMMRRKSYFSFAENVELECKVLEVPYTGDRIAMVLILPNEIEGLGALETKLTPTAFQSLLKSMHNQEVKVALPKFKLEIGIVLNDILKSMGIQELFSHNDADLTGISTEISKEDNLVVSKVFHKAFVDVNEEGTVAAAVTYTTTNIVFLSGKLETKKEFVADHPFLFVIYDKHSDIILFMGRLTDPDPSRAGLPNLPLGLRILDRIAFM